MNKKRECVAVAGKVFSSRYGTHSLVIKVVSTDYIRKPSKIPAAIAEPITPATFGPIACISR